MFLHQGYILHRRPYRETSFLVDVLTQESGKLRFVARGQRNRKNGGSQLLQPFRPLQLMLAGRGDLKQLRSIEAASLGPVLQGRGLFSALYLNELLCRLLEDELPVPQLFEAYRSSLQALADTTGSVEPVLRDYELLLLAELGYGPDFYHHHGGDIETGAFYQFDHTLGFIQCAGGATESASFRGEDLLAIAERHWHSEALRAAKRLNRLALQPLLGRKPLKSRELFIALKSE